MGKMVVGAVSEHYTTDYPKGRLCYISPYKTDFPPNTTLVRGVFCSGLQNSTQVTICSVSCEDTF